MIWSHEMGPDGAALVALIHGAMDRSAGMVKLSRKLDTTHRVVRYDRRGYGRSKPHPGPFTMSDQVTDLADVLGGRRAVLFGHSFGGNVALAFAERHPELVRAVAVYETPLSWLPWWPGTTSRGRSAEAARGRAEQAAERFLRRMAGDERWEALPDKTKEERRAEGEAFVGELTDLSMNAPWHAERIDVPVVVMYGELGREHHRDGSHYLAEEFGAGSPIEIAAANHHGPFTHPDPVADVLRDLETTAPP